MGTRWFAIGEQLAGLFPWILAVTLLPKESVYPHSFGLISFCDPTQILSSETVKAHLHFHPVSSHNYFVLFFGMVGRLRRPGYISRSQRESELSPDCCQGRAAATPRPPHPRDRQLPSSVPIIHHNHLQPTNTITHVSR